MRFRMITTETGTSVLVRTELTEEMFAVTSDESHELKNKEGKVIFKLDWDSEHAAMSQHGICLAGQSFSFDERCADPAAVKLQLGMVKANADKVEAQIKKEYAAVVKAAEDVESEEF